MNTLFHCVKLYLMSLVIFRGVFFMKEIDQYGSVEGQTKSFQLIKYLPRTFLPMSNWKFEGKDICHRMR